MGEISDDMKAQMMKLMGMTNKNEFENIFKDYAGSAEMKNLKKKSAFDVQFVLMKNSIEELGMNKFTDLKTVEEKIKYVLSILDKDPDQKNIRKMFPAKNSEKNAERSKKMRDLGNKAFQKKYNEDAIRYYNDSILLAPIEEKKGREVALGLGNRSVVFFNLNEYEKCLGDIEGALMFGYPEDLQYKVYERMGRCYQALKKLEEAKESYQKTFNIIEVSKISEEKKDVVRKDIEECLEKINTSSDEEEKSQPIALLAEKNQYKIWNPHPQFPAFADTVTIKYRDDVGRHGVATDIIRPGELILVEDPITWSVNPSRLSSLCHNCVRPLGRSPFPSPYHHSATFCSFECLKTALVDYHDVEGKLALEDLFGTGEENGNYIPGCIFLAYRCITRKPLEFFLKNEKELFSEVNLKYGTDNPEGWKLEGDCSIYKGLHNLVSHSDKMTNTQCLTLVIRSIVLLKCLQAVGYFASIKTATEGLSKEELLIVGLLYHFQSGIGYNNHGIYQAEELIEAGKRLPLTDVGATVYPTLLLLNHSCCPNTLRINQGKKTFLVAKKTIQPGEEVTDCYGVHHLSRSREDRLETLKKGFAFTCNCEACLDDWPLLPGLETKMTPAQMAKVGNLLSKYQTQFKEQKFSRAKTFCVEYIEKLAELGIDKLHRNAEIAFMALSSCYWAALQ